MTEQQQPSWSPMMCLPKATLTASGLLALDTNDGEVELMRRSGMEFRHEGTEPMAPMSSRSRGESWVDRNVDLIITLTTHRIVFMTTDHKEARFLHLSNVHQAQSTGGANLLHWNASHKLLLNTYAFGEVFIVFRSNRTSPQKDRDDMLQLLDKALERRAWEVASRLEQKKKTMTSTEVAKRKVGVDAILTKNALRHKEAARLAEQTLSGDAEQLLSEAAELIGVIQKYVATLSKDNSNNENTDDTQRLAGMLQDMGMASALTKEDVTTMGIFATRNFVLLVHKDPIKFELEKDHV